MLKRLENGKLSLDSLGLEIFIGDLFAKCKTEHEVEWLQETLLDCVECGYQDRLTEMEDEEE